MDPKAVNKQVRELSQMIELFAALMTRLGVKEIVWDKSITVT